MPNPLQNIARFFNEAVPDWVRRMNPARSFRTYHLGGTRIGLTSPEDALKIATVFRCVALIAETTAALPWNVYKRKANGDGIRQANNPVEWLLHHRASDEQTAFNFRRGMVVNRLLWGNGYAEIQRDQANRPYALHLLHPSRVTPGRDANGRIVYRVLQSDGAHTYLPAADVYHLRGLGDDLAGMSVLDHAATTLGINISFDRSLQKFFGDGFRPMGFFKTKGKLGLEGFKALEARLEEYSGLSNRWKALPLDQDMEFEALAVSPEDAQLVDLRKLSNIDICRLFGVPPHMAYDLDRATFSNIEAQGRDFLTYGLLPHIVQMEQEADWKLLSGNHSGLYSKVNVNAIVRADMQVRYAAYQIALNSGGMNINEFRALEEMPNIGPEGDVYVRQVQYQPIGTELTPEPVKPAPGAPPAADPNAPPPAKK